MENNWINVKERLPEEGKKVLIHTKFGEIEKASLWNDLQFTHKQDYHWGHYGVDGNNRLEETEVTHWMPLPELPKL